MAVSASVATCRQCKHVTSGEYVELGDTWSDNLPGSTNVRPALRHSLLVCCKPMLKVSLSQMLMDQV